MKIKDFIEKAIKGGWKGLSLDVKSYENAHYAMLLDPLAWQAVGKAEGWPQQREVSYDSFNNQREEKKVTTTIRGEWQNKMHSMIDHIASGNSSESYIETL